MLVGQFGDGLQFDNYFVVAHKIGQIFLAQDSPSVLQGQSRLRDCWDSAMLKFNAETFLIHGLVKATALVLVNLEAGANDRLTLILEDEIRHYFFWRHSACLEDHQILRPDHSNQMAQLIFDI